MTEKRFHKGYVLGDTGLIDEQKGEWFIENINSVSDLRKNWDKVIDKLNEVNDEKEKLKQENEELTGKASSWKITASEEIVKQAELAKENVKLKQENTELKTFKDNVFDKINEYIETSDKYRKPIETLKYGEELGYWNGVYQRMNRLKRELKE